jgi:chromosome segregation ATPase
MVNPSGSNAVAAATQWRHESFEQMDQECRDLQEYCNLLEKEVDEARREVHEARAVAAHKDALLTEVQRELDTERVQVNGLMTYTVYIRVACVYILNAPW